MQITNTSMLPPLPVNEIQSLQKTNDGPPPEEVAESFEAVFGSLLIKEMRNTLSDGLFGSESSDVFGGLFDLYMGKAMTEGNGLGIKQLVLTQLESDASTQNQSKQGSGDETRNQIIGS